MTTTLLWEGWGDYRGHRARAVFNGNRIIFEQASKKDMLCQWVWEMIPTSPVKFDQYVAEMIMKEKSRGT